MDRIGGDGAPGPREIIGGPPKKHVWNDFHGEDRLYDPPKFTVVPTRKIRPYMHGSGDEGSVFDKEDAVGHDGEFFFVLRPERDKAAWDALWSYADAVEHRSPNLAAQIRDKLGEIRIKQGV